MMTRLAVLLQDPIDWLEERHPLLGMVLWQFASALFLIAAVGGAALAGGTVIWMFYKAVGVM